MKKNYLQLLASVFLSLFIATTDIQAETLTIADGTEENNNIPIDGYNLDAVAGQRTQMILHAADLTAMVNGTINELTFYLKDNTENHTFSSTTTISLGTTNSDHFASNDFLTDVVTSSFSGKLSFEGAIMTITLHTPFLYTGGNLLIDFNSNKGNYKRTYFVGVSTSEDMSLYEKGTSKTLHKFTPKITFAYDPQVNGPALRINTNEILFDYIKSTTSQTKEIILRNIGSTDVTISSIEALAAPFSIEGEVFPLIIPSKASKTISIAYQPTEAGTDEKTVTFVNNGDQPSITLSLSGSAYPVDAFFESFENSLWGSKPYQIAGWRHRFSASVSYSQSSGGGVDNSKYIYHSFSTNFGDTIVSPKVKGNISYYAKNYNSGGSIQVFTSTDLQNWTPATITPTTGIVSTWTKYEIKNLPEGTYIGFVLANAGLDEFFAESGFIPTQDIEVTTIGTLTSGINEGVKTPIKFSVYNWGESIIEPANYQFEVRTTDGNLLKTISAKESIAPNTKIDISDTIQFNLTNKIPTRLSVYVEAVYADDQDLTNNQTYTQSVLVTPLIGITKLINAGTAEEPRDFGYIAGPESSRTLKFKIENTGISPLTISSIAIKAPFSCQEELPIVLVNKGDSKEISITLQAAAGFYQDSILITHDGAATSDKYIYVKGQVEPSGYMIESFHSMEFPPIFWSQKTTDPAKTWKRELNGSYTNTYQTTDLSLNIDSCYLSAAEGDTLITPLMNVLKKDSLQFYTRYSASSGISFLKVLYSTNQQEWTEIANIEKEELSALFKPFSVQPPLAKDEEGYFAFVGNSVYLDMIRGYQQIMKAYDLGILSFTTAGKHTANYGSPFTVQFRNYGSQSLQGEDYTILLKKGDEQVATLPGVDIASKEFGQVTFDYASHLSGMITLTAEILLEEDEDPSNNISEPLTFIVQKESDSALVEVGIIGSPSMSPNTVPNSNYKHSAIKSIYTPADLEGLRPGMTIDSLYIPYYSNFDYSGYVQAWISTTTEGTDEELVKSMDVSGMIKLSGERIQNQGSASEPALLKYKLATPLLYEGGNICVIFAIDSTKYKSGVTFFKKSVSANQSVSYNIDGSYTEVAPEIFNGLSMNPQTYLLAIKLKATRPAPYVDGFVKDNQNNPVEGALVTFHLEQVTYQATTNNLGYYKLQIFQSSKTYNLSVTKEGFESHSDQQMIGAENKSINITLDQIIVGIEEQEASLIHIYSFRDGLFVIDSATEIDQTAVYSSSGTLILLQKDGSKQIDLSARPKGIYIIRMQSGQKETITKVNR